MEAVIAVDDAAQGVDLEHADRDGLGQASQRVLAGPHDLDGGLEHVVAGACEAWCDRRRGGVEHRRVVPVGGGDHAQVDAVAAPGVEEVHDDRSEGVRGEADRGARRPDGSGPLPRGDDRGAIAGDDQVQRRSGPDDPVPGQRDRPRHVHHEPVGAEGGGDGVGMPVEERGQRGVDDPGVEPTVTAHVGGIDQFRLGVEARRPVRPRGGGRAREQ